MSNATLLEISCTGSFVNLFHMKSTIFFWEQFPPRYGYNDFDWLVYTVKPVLSGHSKIDKTKILMTNGSLMKVESMAECSPWSILQYF